MSRVSSFGQQQVLITSIMQNQQRVFDAQRQISTGKKSEDYAGLGGDTGAALGARSFKSRVDTYQATIAAVRGKLNANDVQVGGMIDAMSKLKETIQTTLANNQAEGFNDVLNQTFSFMSNALNTNYDGTYLFSGAKTGTKPVNVTSLQQLAALPATGDAFDNGKTPMKAKIADGVDLQFGLLASDVGQGAFDQMLPLYNSDQGANGPLNGKLTDAQRTFLQGQVSALGSAIDNMRQYQVKNGLANSRIDVVDQQHTDTSTFLQTFIADIEDVNVAEAVSRLNNDQTALEASYKTIGSLSQLTLLKFL